MPELSNLQSAVMLAAIGTVALLHSSVGHGELLVWRPVFVSAVVVGVAGPLLGWHLGANNWRTATFRRAPACVLWIAAGKFILTEK